MDHVDQARDQIKVILTQLRTSGVLSDHEIIGLKETVSNIIKDKIIESEVRREFAGFLCMYAAFSSRLDNNLEAARLNRERFFKIYDYYYESHKGACFILDNLSVDTDAKLIWMHFSSLDSGARARLIANVPNELTGLLIEFIFQFVDKLLSES